MIKGIYRAGDTGSLAFAEESEEPGKIRVVNINPYCSEITMSDENFNANFLLIIPYGFWKNKSNDELVNVQGWSLKEKEICIDCLNKKFPINSFLNNFLPFAPMTAPFPAQRRKMFVLRNHDGDTFTGYLLQEPPIDIRIDGIDAPELKEPRGIDAKNYLNSLIVGEVIDVILEGKQSFNREVAKVLLSNGEDVANVLAQAGFKK